MVNSELAAVLKCISDSTSTIVRTDDENVSDGKENEREPNRKSYPAIDGEVFE